MPKGRIKTKRLSGHGDLHKRKLSTGALTQISTKGKTMLTIGGKQRSITKCNVKNGSVEWYKRSDTKKIALRNYCRDGSIHARTRSGKKRGMEGDTRYVKSKNAWM